MTKLQALQSLTEYENDDLLTKLLLDRGVTGGDDYAASDAKEIDLCAASLYFTLAGHPDLREGSFAVKYNGVQLMAMAKMILRKYDEDIATITGEAII